MHRSSEFGGSRLQRTWLKLALGMTAALAAAATLQEAGSAMQSTYTVTNIGTLGGDRSVAMGLNASAQVVGYSTTATGRTHAFFYAAGAIQDLGTLGGRDSFAYAISNNGLIVGRAQDSSGKFQAFVTVRGTPLTDVTRLTAFDAEYSVATAVSAIGDAVGYSVNATAHAAARNRLFLVAGIGSTPIDLGTFGGFDSVVSGINDARQFAGYYAIEPHADYANRRSFVTRPGADPVDLGTLGGPLTTATALNNKGQVTGWAQRADGQFRAFLYSGGTLVDLGTLTGGRQSFGYDIDEDGRVVGASDASGSGLRAVLHDGTRMIDLNTRIPAGSGWVLTEARGINPDGEIVGAGILGGEVRAFLLTPQ